MKKQKDWMASEGMETIPNGRADRTKWVAAHRMRDGMKYWNAVRIMVQH
ncbi:MAG: hypothetical protein CM1200mP18_19440 [Gammaproteobacteria bacterium]|nr:MAG: hypothetical protein CM1200mP18_19440 [Gammaproteobacteria bacterium]